MTLDHLTTLNTPWLTPAQLGTIMEDLFLFFSWARLTQS